MLEVERLTRYFGGLAAVKNVSFKVHKGEILGIIGPNGSGKTTIFNLITGFMRPTGGSIRFKERNIVGYKPNRIVKMGIARTFQLIRPFRTLTVEDNIKVALMGAFKNSEVDFEGKIDEVLKLMGLHEKGQLPVGVLSYVDQKKVEIARALATGPSLLLLDEPFPGLSLSEAATIHRLLKDLNSKGVTLTIIEHRFREIMELVERVIVLNCGEIIAEGSPAEVAKNERVVEAFIGKGAI